jgi:hypothetical protein
MRTRKIKEERKGRKKKREKKNDRNMSVVL